MPHPETGQKPNPPNTEEWGGRTTDPDRPPPAPTREETEKGKEAAEKVRTSFDDDCAWYKPWTWGCDDPESPRELLDGMSPGEINALFGELSDEEIRELLEQDGVVDVLKVRADASLLHQLERIAPKSVEPDFTDVRANGEKPSDPATGWGTVPDGQLFGPGGAPSLEDINQGAIGDFVDMNPIK